MGRIQKKKTTTAKSKSVKSSADATHKSSQASLGQKKKTSPGKQPAGKSQIIALKKSSGTAKPVALKQKKNFIDKSLQFLREVRVELKKVTWPSRKQTIGSTVVVIILVMIISFFLGTVDLGLSSLIRVILP